MTRLEARELALRGNGKAIIEILTRYPQDIPRVPAAMAAYQAWQKKKGTSHEDR